MAVGSNHTESQAATKLAEPKAPQYSAMVSMRYLEELAATRDSKLNCPLTQYFQAKHTLLNVYPTSAIVYSMVHCVFFNCVSNTVSRFV